METKIRETRREIYGNLTAWQRVQIARHTQRPFALDYISRCFTEWIELHGDRLFGDDKAMPSGLAKLGPHRCVVITHQKGRDTKENVKRNFGCAHPEGYRKALRLMRARGKVRVAGHFAHRHAGAYPGIGSEERHISEAIAVNLREMMTLRVPIVAVVIGEGGSGGALGIGVADRVLILENAYYSVISPEACSAILWKDRKHAPEAAEALKLTAQDLVKLGVVDEIVPEPEGGAHRDHDLAAANLGNRVASEFAAQRSIRRSMNCWRSVTKSSALSEISPKKRDPDMPTTQPPPPNPTPTPPPEPLPPNPPEPPMGWLLL